MMYGKCKVHDVELILEESREYPGKTYPVCPQCRKEFADSFKEFADSFKGPDAAQEKSEWPNTTTNSAMDAIRLCSDLVSWHDERNLSFGDPYEQLISRARSIAEQHQ